MQESIFSKQVKAGGKMYFFDVRQAQGGQQSKYIRVTESWLKDGQSQRGTITVFPEQIKTFIEAFQEATEQVS